MGGGEKLAGVHGFGDSGLLDRNQIRRNDLRVFANSMEYLDENGEHVGQRSMAAPWLAARVLADAAF